MFFILVILVVYLFFILQAIAFFTLVERHLLGLTQNRFGPNNSSLYGLIQAILDGVNLINNEQVYIFNCSISIFIGVTLGNFCLMFIEFLTLPYYFSFITISWSYLLIILILGVNVYFLLCAGLFSNSNYAYLGGIRSGVASVSYEISFSLSMLIFMFYNNSYSLYYVWNLGVLLILPSVLISFLVELGRTPFDYPESESELVSGFNTEYSSVSFVLLFLNEYGSLLFFSIVLSVLFFNGYFIITVLLFSLFVFIRSSYPRLRYDNLIGLMWLQLFFQIVAIIWAIYFVFIF